MKSAMKLALKSIMTLRAIAAGAAAICLAAFLVWAASRQAAPVAAGSPLPSFMPNGAMLYIEAQDFSGILAEWNASPEKRQWLTSDDYEVFSRSRLFGRLGQAQREFATAAGVPPDMNLLSQTAGKESALALYDIGKLEFLYITREPSASAMQSSLWQSRGKFETRSAGGVAFYVHTDASSGRTVAFAVTNDYLLLATREDLLASSLDLIAGGSGPKLTGEDWYTQAVASAGAPGDLRMVLNMEKIAAAPYFRSYWIQPNAKDLRDYSAAICDLHLGGSEYHEDRVLLPKAAESAPQPAASAATATPPAADSSPAQAPANSAGPQAVADLLRLVPPDAAVYRAIADPSADESLALLDTKILAPENGPAPPPSNAPNVTLTAGIVGNASDLETRIDQPPQVRAAVDPSSQLRAVLAASNVRASLSFDSTYADSATSFIEIHSAVVLSAASDWNAPAVEAAFARAIGQPATTQQLGAAWTPAGTAPGDFFQLDGLLPIRLAVRGNLLIVANNSADMTAVLDHLPSRPDAAPATFAAGFRLASAQPGLIRLSTALDRANSTGTSDYPDNPPAEPAFFSGNLASLGRVFSGLDSESVVVRNSGGKTFQSVTYRWK